MFIRLKNFFILYLLFYSINSVAIQNDKKAALVLIDMQEYFMGGDIYNNQKYQTLKSKLINYQISIINKAKEINMPIIIIEYECENCDQTISSIKDAVLNYPHVVFMKKTSNGMLSDENIYRDDILKYLKINDIRTLVIAGINGGVCILESVYDALRNGYDVITLRKGIAHFDLGGVAYPSNFNYSNVCTFCKDRLVLSVDSFSELLKHHYRQK